MIPLALADQVVQLIEQARALPACRESALVIVKLQEAYLWLIEMQAIENETSDLGEDTPEEGTTP